MPGFDKVCAYQTVDSTDKEDESNSQCQSQLDDTDNIKGMFLLNYDIYVIHSHRQTGLPESREFSS